MTRGDTESVGAAVTLEHEPPASKVIRTHSLDGSTRPLVMVSCVIDAQLTAAPRQFDVATSSWVERSLLTTSTARWHWFVTPREGGSHTLMLSLRPVVHVRRLHARAGAGILVSDSAVFEYPIAVRVRVPWTQWLPQQMSSLAATLNIAKGLLEAITAFVLAALALAAALRLRKGRSSGAGPSDP